MQKKVVSLLPSAVFFLLLSLFLLMGEQKIVATISRFGIEQGATLLQNAVFAFSSPFLPENKQQEKALAVLSNRAKDVQEQKEMQALRDQFEATSIPSVKLLPAKVIGFEGFLPGVSRPTQLVLDRGELDGVRIGQAVVIKNNLVGRIGKLTDHRSQVTLLTKSGWSFTGKTTKTNAQGLLVIEGGDVLLKNVVLSDVLSKKDLVVTKGDEKINGTGFPPDIVVGEILSVDKKASALFQTAKVRSFVDIVGLSTVFVYMSQK